MAERFMSVDEIEANVLYRLVIERLKNGPVPWDLTDEEMWAEVLILKDLEEKLEAYLDGK